MAYIYYFDVCMSEVWLFLCFVIHELVIIQEYDLIQGSIEPRNHTCM